MMFAAWSFGVPSGIYINVDTSAMKQDYALPSNLNITTVVGFGYPDKKVIGKKTGSHSPK